MSKLSPSRQTKILMVSLSLLFLASAVVARSTSISGIEKSLFLFIYHLPGFIAPIMHIVSQFGSVMGMLIVCLCLLAIKKQQIALDVFLSGWLAYIVATVGKVMVDRPRPTELLENVSGRYGGALGPGFPSAHVAISTAVTFALFYCIPKNYRPLLYTWVVLIALSRMYLGVHLPLDTIGGFCIGMLAGFTVHQHARKSNART